MSNMEHSQTLNEIQAQIAQLQAKENEIRAAELATVVSEINQKIAAFGLRPGDLKFKPDAKGESAGIGKKAPIKYRDKNGKTWSGRGLKPNWLAAEISAGKSLTDFAV